MSQSENPNRDIENPFRKKSWLNKIGLWTALLTLTVVAVGVFALCACKTSGSGRW